MLAGKSFDPGSSKLRRWARTLRALMRQRSRTEMLTRRRYGSRYFQESSETLFHRYPVLFKYCQESLSKVQRPRVLSFGCATGEEVVSLGEYLPDAEIFGVDMNPWCLRACAQHAKKRRFIFMHRDSVDFAKLSGLDAIFCMAVFQRTENREPGIQFCVPEFCFQAFEAELKVLDQKLAVGGLLFLDHCDFRFEDAELSRHYDVIAGDSSWRTRNRSIFGKDGRLLAQEYRAPRIFRKRESQSN